MDCEKLIYEYEIQQDKITETACVTCTWDVDGIWVDLNYAYDAVVGSASCQVCFAALWTDEESNWPSDALWQEAIEAAEMLSTAYGLPLTISNVRQD